MTFFSWHGFRSGRAAAALALFLLPHFAHAGVHRYEIIVDGGLDRFKVHACFEGKAPSTLAAESDGARFYLESMRVGDRSLEPEGDRVTLGAVPDNTCVDYTVKLDPAKGAAQSGGTETRRIGGGMLTAIGDWLWRTPDADASLELRFRVPQGIEVSTPWQRELDAQGRAFFTAGPTPANWPGIVAFGHFKPRDIEVPGAVIHVALMSLDTPAYEEKFVRWITGAARNAAQLHGRFPVASLQIVVAPTPRGRGPVPWAYVSRGGGPAIHLFVNATRPVEEFEQDWSLTHEMSHLFLPYVVSRDAWLYEGVPTYLQNELMARGGAITADEAWRRMQSGFVKGAAVAPGLSVVRANERVAFGGVYLRVYWAGAAMMLAADLQLRADSGGTQSLDSALEQLARCCATEYRRWTAAEVMARLDELTGTTIFSDVMRAQLVAEGFPDYRSTFGKAGIDISQAGVQFDAAAPWAAAAEATMRPR